MYASDNDGAIVDPTQLSVLAAFDKIRFSTKKEGRLS